MSDEHFQLLNRRMDSFERGQRSLDNEVRALRQTDVPDLRVEIATLKGRASAWGAFAGMAGSAIVGLILHLIK